MTVEISSDLVANLIAINVVPGDKVAIGDEVALLESMKMEIPVLAEQAGTVSEVKAKVGDVLQEGEVIISLD